MVQRRQSAAGGGQCTSPKRPITRKYCGWTCGYGSSPFELGTASCRGTDLDPFR